MEDHVEHLTRAVRVWFKLEFRKVLGLLGFNSNIYPFLCVQN